MGLFLASPLCPPILLRTEVRLWGGLPDNSGLAGWSGEKASRGPQDACPRAPPDLPCPCNFLPLRWREGNVKDDGLKGGSWGQERRDRGVEGKGNRQKAGGREQGREGPPQQNITGWGEGNRERPEETEYEDQEGETRALTGGTEEDGRG